MAKRSKYGIRPLWINAHTYNQSFLFFFFRGVGAGGGDRRREECVFMGKEGARFEVAH